MSKWASNQISDSGILRKSELKEKKEELFVFGYTCKLFRDDERAIHVDQGKHLIPWMGDDTLKIDRYDARGALHDLSRLEPPTGGYDWRVELTKTELEVEQMCDEERYRALHTNEDEEEMYREEELKRLHAAGYGQVGFTYDTAPQSEPPPAPTEVEEPYVPVPEFKALFPDDIVYPETIKLNAIIEKTAKFIASQGLQMEILLRAKQADNPQFNFLNKDTPLNKYYVTLINIYKLDKWPPKKQEEHVEEIHDEYLHPSLGTTLIESAPSIPSIHYKPSADCDYTMLISKIRGDIHPPEENNKPHPPADLVPPGTEPMKLPQPHIARGPVLYSQASQATEQPKKGYEQYAAPMPPKPLQPPHATNQNQTTPSKSTGLSLMKNYDTDTDSESDASTPEIKRPKTLIPPEDVKAVIEKMAAYVAKNGDEFADIVRARNDPRFTFLEPTHMYHEFYKTLMQQNRIECENENKIPVSFSIKKQKEPDPVLPKPALPYESSSEEEEPTEEVDDPTVPQIATNTTVPQSTTNIVPPVVMYRIESEDKPLHFYTINEIVEPAKPVEIPLPVKVDIEEELKLETTVLESKREEKSRKERKKSKRRKRDYSRSRSRSRDRRHKKSSNRSPNRRKKEKKKEECDIVISLEENYEELIDLTDDVADVKAECDIELEKSKQIERRKRAAEFLKKVGVDPAAASLPTSSLASAMVDTLETLKKKKEVEDRRKRRDKKRHRDKYDRYSSDDSSHRGKRRRRSKDRRHEDDDYEESSKRKRRKDKKQSKTEKSENAELNIDLVNTLKELRSSSPTRVFVPEGVTTPQRESSSSEEEVEKKKRREYSEGECSTHSDSSSVHSD